ncbi:hypothetical protein ACFUCV_00485 [Specibacter sp. NPDC057265]|uniref:hypothetical protein n=1 Tax=Specibacter sp. NPDC057265 TaxID=3346075 RepID=UPI00362AF85C
MEAIWIGLALVVSVFGGWPMTAGILRIAKSKTVRAVDAAEVAERTGPPAPTDADPADAAPADAGPTDADPADAAPDAAPTGPTGPAPASAPRTEVLRGGLLIGFLERAAVAVAILAGQPIAIAYVVAIKGLGRYPELKDTPAASERFIIGTLASMLWSAGVAVLTKIFLDIG